MALVLALGVLVLLAAQGLDGGDDAPRAAQRDHYGGHGGAPAVRTGPAGRVALDGRWRVTTDPAGTGADRGFHRGRFDGRAVRLPFVPNAGEITGEAGVRSFEGSVAWYRTTLRVPRSGRYAIRFESVNHRAAVWLDGRRVGSHTGTYLPFEVRRDLEAGRDHLLVVRADWRDPAAMKAEGWHRAWFNYGGINREVTIRPLTDAEIPSAWVRTTLPHGPPRGTDGRATARLEVRARARNAGRARTLRVTGVLRGGAAPVRFAFPATEVPGGASREVRTSVTIRGAALWSPDDPTLHDLELRVGDRPAWRGRIGLRSLRRDGTTLLLNGKPLRLRGASLHEDVPGRGDGLHPPDEDALVRDLERLGANATRAQHALSPSLMERLDAAGILVWLGVGPVDAPGAWTSRGPRLVERAKERVRRSLAQLQTHPSLLAWNLANEAAGQGHPAGQAPYVDAMARELRERDPGRLVALDIWGSHPPRWDGPMYRNIDAIGWTNYLGWYHSPHAGEAELRELIETHLGQLRGAFPDKVIAITEFGAEGTPRNRRDEPGGYDFQSRMLRTHLRTYARMDDVAGMLVWNLRDFGVAPSFAGGSITRVVPDIKLVPGLNEKGLMSHGGRPKPAAEAVRREFERIAGRPAA
jgi:hypothetical protein